MAADAGQVGPWGLMFAADGCVQCAASWKWKLQSPLAPPLGRPDENERVAKSKLSEMTESVLLADEDGRLGLRTPPDPHVPPVDTQPPGPFGCLAFFSFCLQPPIFNCQSLILGRRLLFFGGGGWCGVRSAAGSDSSPMSSGTSSWECPPETCSASQQLQSCILSVSSFLVASPLHLPPPHPPRAGRPVVSASSISMSRFY